RPPNATPPPPPPNRATSGHRPGPVAGGALRRLEDVMTLLHDAAADFLAAYDAYRINPDVMIFTPDKEVVERLREALDRPTEYALAGGSPAPIGTADALGELVREQTVGGA